MELLVVALNKESTQVIATDKEMLFCASAAKDKRKKCFNPFFLSTFKFSELLSIVEAFH